MVEATSIENSPAGHIATPDSGGFKLGSGQYRRLGPGLGELPVSPKKIDKSRRHFQSRKLNQT